FSFLRCHLAIALSLFHRCGGRCHLPLSLHDALPISPRLLADRGPEPEGPSSAQPAPVPLLKAEAVSYAVGKHTLVDQVSFHLVRSEEHTSELQSRENLVCRLLLEKKK